MINSFKEAFRGAPERLMAAISDELMRSISVCLFYAVVSIFLSLTNKVRSPRAWLRVSCRRCDMIVVGVAPDGPLGVRLPLHICSSVASIWIHHCVHHGCAGALSAATAAFVVGRLVPAVSTPSRHHGLVSQGGGASSKGPAHVHAVCMSVACVVKFAVQQLRQMGYPLASLPDTKPFDVDLLIKYAPHVAVAVAAP
jgi:hypothetical protein